jgi:hypothetical protein
MEFVKFNRVAPIVVDAPDLLGPNPTIWRWPRRLWRNHYLQQISPDIRILDFSDAFTRSSRDDCYESSALQQAIKLGYFEHITEVVCSNVASYEEGSYDAEYREHVDNAITAFCDF